MLQFNTNVNRCPGGTEILLPTPDDDVIYIFSHVLQHFFKGGVGIRQLCDLARLLWTFRYDIDQTLLLERLKAMGIVSEWKVFGVIMVDFLGLAQDAMPFYDKSYCRKSQRALSYLLRVGNFGHNKDVGYQRKYPAVVRKLITFFRQAKDSMELMLIFPIDATKNLFHFFFVGCGNIMHGR